MVKKGLLLGSAPLLIRISPVGHHLGAALNEIFEIQVLETTFRSFKSQARDEDNDCILSESTIRYD